MANDFDEGEKTPKPKKFAELKVVIWDDGELDMDLVLMEPREEGRGAPRKIGFKPSDYTKWMDEVDAMAMSKYGLMKFIKDSLGINHPDVDKAVKAEDFDIDDEDEDNDE